MNSKELSKKEEKACNSFIEKLKVKRRDTTKPLIIAIVGLVGSGKSSVAKELARHIGAIVIEGDKIRIELRKQDERYEGARKIAENVISYVIQQGGNVVIDSDNITEVKRIGLEKLVKALGARLVYIRTFMNIDVMLGRIITANYRDDIEDFFGGASTKWQGSEQSKGAVIKLREMWRRTPHHHDWSDRGGGIWALKKLLFAVFAEIDTTETEKWQKEVKKIAQQLNTF